MKKITLWLILILFGPLFSVKVWSVDLPLDHLVAWWPFEPYLENPYWGIGNPYMTGNRSVWEMTAYNSGSLSLVEGPKGQALSFATDGGAYLVSVESFTWPANAFTIAGWAKPSSLNTDGANWLGFVTFGNSGSTFNLEFKYGKGHSRINGWYDKYWTEDSMVELDKFHFVAVTYDGSTLTFYQDGVQVGQTNPSLLGSPPDVSGLTHNFYLGLDLFGSHNYFEGVMDEITLWSTALSADEIYTLYSQGGSPISTPVPLPGAFWLLSGGLGVLGLRRILNS